MTSMARFLALMEYQESKNSQILHVESDVILAPDFPMQSFEELNFASAFPIISQVRGVASVLYLQDLESSQKLSKTMFEELKIDNYTSDMLILGKHYSQGNDVCALPIAPGCPKYYRDFTPARIQSEWDKNRELFQGVFDGADVGIYYFGTDPRNARGTSFLQQQIPTEYGITENWNLEYSKKRNFINFLVGNEAIPLYCLHVTSKQLRMFTVKLPKKLVEKRIKKLNRESTEFYVRVAIIQLVTAIRRRIRVALK
jgi:hypothetical protein